MPEKQATLAEVVRKARLDRGWSLRKAERETGIHNAHLAQIEGGTISRPDHNLLFALASTYELEYARLLRLAGHVSDEQTTSKQRSAYGAVAWRALTALEPDEQREVVDFIAEIQRRRSEEAHGR